MIKSSNSEARPFAATGMGSLPPMPREEALEWAFAVDIPYLPERPQKAAHATLPLGDRPPLWNEFLSKLTTSPASLAKVQLFGLFTLSQGFRELETSPEDEQEQVLSDLSGRIHDLVSAMADDIRKAGKQTIFFLDEPAWGGWDPREGSHSRVKEKTEALLAAFRAKGIRTGMHCCARADFFPWLTMNLDYLSFDAALSLGDVLGMGKALRGWMDAGGRLCFGIVPTRLPANYDVDREFRNFMSAWNAFPGGYQRREFLREALWTPACGLGLRKEKEASRVFGALAEFQRKLREIESGGG